MNLKIFMSSIRKTPQEHFKDTIFIRVGLEESLLWHCIFIVRFFASYIFSTLLLQINKSNHPKQSFSFLCHAVEANFLRIALSFKVTLEAQKDWVLFNVCWVIFPPVHLSSGFWSNTVTPKGLKVIKHDFPLIWYGLQNRPDGRKDCCCSCSPAEDGMNQDTSMSGNNKPDLRQKTYTHSGPQHVLYRSL